MDKPATEQQDATNATATELEPGSPASPSDPGERALGLLERIATALEQLIARHFGDTK